MNLVSRLLLAFALVAVFAAGIAGWLGYNSASRHFQQWMGEGIERGFGMGQQGRGQQVLLQELRDSSLQSVAIALVAALAVGGYLAYRLVQPIARLTDATRRYGQGERDVRVVVQGYDELAKMGRVFNQVAEQLAHKEVAERQMVADIAHELRTPLTVLKADLESLEDGLLEAKPEVFHRLVGEVDVLGRLVQDLRMLSLAEAGELRLNLRPVDLTELVALVQASFVSQAEAKGIQISTQLQPITLQADPERLRQILANLIANALRHTLAGGWIVIGLEASQTRAHIEVRDSGPGIPSEHLQFIFERFYKVDSARGRDAGGSGLGLAIVKALVEAHGGSISVQNIQTGGASFKISLPA